MLFWSYERRDAQEVKNVKIARRFILRSILDNRRGRMKAVYEHLVARGLIQPVLHDGSSVQVAAGLW